MPLITFYIFTYNQEKYIRDALESALAQDYKNLEIIISDDCSNDKTIHIIKSIIKNYKGLHKVYLNINEINLGIGAHVNKAFQISNGEFIVFAAGDDISYPNRVTCVVDTWLASNKNVSAIFSGAKIIDENNQPYGNLKVAISEIKIDPYNLITYVQKNNIHLVMGATAAYAPDLMEKFGGLLLDVNVEDVPLVVRSSLDKGVIYLDKPLVAYRKNVSVWLPRKLKNESFARHRERMFYLMKMKYEVAKQINHDVSLYACHAEVKRAARERLVASEFVYQCTLKNRFMFFDFFKRIFQTSYWKFMLFPNILTSNRFIHFLVYKIYSFFKVG